MAEAWLTIIGLGEDGLNGLTGASRAVLDQAKIIFGGPRHLDLVQAGARGQPWPSPFSIEPVLEMRGQRVTVLVSGDPFWHGAGGTLAARVAPDEFQVFPSPSTFSLAAARLGWRLEETLCLGLHAAPFERLVPVLSPGVKAICLLENGDAPAKLASWLTSRGFGPSQLHVLQALGGPRERLWTTTAQGFEVTDIAAPVAMAIDTAGGKGLPRTAGLPDALFASDGQITKRPIRAVTLSALAPRPGEVLWDLGAGSGSVSIEWLLLAPATRAIALEPRADRIANIRGNAEAFGLSHRIEIVEGSAPDALAGLATPDAVFVGGGASEAVLQALWDRLAPGTRIVANAVTLETEALLTDWHARAGGELMRVELADAAPLGRMRGWERARPIIQWSVTR